MLAITLEGCHIRFNGAVYPGLGLEEEKKQGRRRRFRGPKTRIAAVAGERGKKPLFPGSRRHQLDAQSRVGELRLTQVILDWKFLFRRKKNSE